MAIPKIQVTGTVLLPGGGAPTEGSITVKLHAPGVTSDGVAVGGRQTFVLGADGSLPANFLLDPNASIVPASWYDVSIKVMGSGGRSYRFPDEKWSIVAGVSPIAIDDVLRIDGTPPVVYGPDAQTLAARDAAAASAAAAAAALSTKVSVSGGDASATVVTPTGATTARTLAARAADVVNVKDYGASPAASGAVNAASFQAAVNAAASLGASVLIPPGTYLLGSKIDMPASPGVSIRGSGLRSTVIQASAAMTAMFEIGQVPANPALFSEFRDLTLQGAGLAEVGIKAPVVAHAMFYRVRIQTTTVHALWVGYGWNNDIVECEIDGNTGTGVYGDAAGALNALNLCQTKVFSNAGWGVWLAGGSTAGNVVGCTIELNRAGGVLVERSALALRIVGNYFEGNAQDGHAFTTPAVTIKAEIVLSGDSATQLGKGFPSSPIIEGNYFYSNYAGSAVYAGGACNLRFVGNTQGYGSNTIPALSFWGETAYAGATGVTYDNNTGFGLYDAPLFVGGHPASGTPTVGFHTWRNPDAPQRNYFPEDPSRHSAVLDVSSGSWIRSAQTYDGWPVYEITGADANSNCWGVSIPIADHPELANRLIYVGCWMRASVGGGVLGGRIYSSAHSGGSGNSYFAATNWRFMSLYLVAPGSGLFTAGFGKIAGAGTSAQSIYVTRPVVAAVGAHYESMWRGPAPGQIAWYGAAAPAAGGWNVGDRIVNSAPAAGQPKAWVCTVAGSPGTWVSEGNL